MKNLLYIGLNGYAGSGKDTVAKMMTFILNHMNMDKMTGWSYFMQHLNTLPITHPDQDIITENCYVIAFADQLKRICSTMFEVPLKYFYDNKSTSWICINNGFELTEIKPNQESIVSAEDYYTGNYVDRHTGKVYMSLRELLVYVGTYVLQRHISQKTFINIVEKKVKEIENRSSYKYVICTDVRFEHEFEFIKNHHGIMVNIVRDGVQQLDNIAEHDLDDVEDYDYVIENNSTYEDLFYQVYDMIMDNIEWKNTTVNLFTHDGSSNFLILKNINENKEYTWELVSEYGMMRTIHNEGSIYSVDPSGGPMISVGDGLNSISNISNILNEYHTVKELYVDEITGCTCVKTLLK